MIREKNRNHNIASKNTVSNVKRKIPLNIGTVIFGAIFIYIIVSLFLYMTATHVVSYQVTAGPLAQNQEYTALVLRDEAVIRSDSSGYLTYYAAENEKVRKTGSVYGIGQEKQTIENSELTDTALASIQDSMEDFTGSFDGANFYDAYNLKYKINGQILSSNMTNYISQGGGSYAMGAQTICTAPNDGIVVYAVDGYEDYDVTMISSEDLDRKAYAKTDLKTSDKLKDGSPVYKLITSDQWSIAIPLSSRQIVDLDGKTQVRVRFLKDNATQIGKLSIITGADGAYYGVITFSNGMIRYVNDRFLDIELVTNTHSGLKIPISSVVNKTFYTIPEEYAMTGGDKNSMGFLRLTIDKDDAESTEFITDTLYEHRDGYYCVDQDEFHEGDILLRSGSSTERFVVGPTTQLEGVYSMNKGYAVFRKIAVIDKNEDYCLIEKGTSFGISQFDFIVLNAEDVKESEITVKK